MPWKEHLSWAKLGEWLAVNTMFINLTNIIYLKVNVIYIFSFACLRCNIRLVLSSKAYLHDPLQLILQWDSFSDDLYILFNTTQKIYTAQFSLHTCLKLTNDLQI